MSSIFNFETKQRLCKIGGIVFGGQPGQYPTVIMPSIFQKGDKIFVRDGRKASFDRQQATELIKMCEKLSQETGLPFIADIVGTTAAQFKEYVDFYTNVTDAPFCVDAWALKPKLDAATYCARKGLLHKMLYNSLTVWEKDLETEIREIAAIGVKHVVLVAFDVEDQMPTGRITGTKRLLAAIEKVGTRFDNLLVDTSVMNGPATAMCSVANKMIKERWGLPTASAPSNGSYMWKAAREMWGQRGWAGADAGLQALAATLYHDVIFSGPMAGSGRVFPAVAMADAFTATMVFSETKQLPVSRNHPLYKLFPEFVQQLKEIQ
jgi:tetrahydromethanopterin S-methyltransferase subunit H